MKTLKDLKEKDNKLRTSETNEFFNGKTIAYQDLRQSAVEWIKELEKYNTKSWSDHSQWNYEKVPDELQSFIDIGGEGIDANTCDIVINWIMHFFNINEEDLKC